MLAYPNVRQKDMPVTKAGSPAFAGLTRIAAQTADDARRLSEVGQSAAGLRQYQIDVAPPLDLDQQRQTCQFVGRKSAGVALGSTREGEEAQLLDAFQQPHWPENLCVVELCRAIHNVLKKWQIRSVSAALSLQKAQCRFADCCEYPGSALAI